MRKLLVIVPALGLLAAGCASVSAKAPVERPALVVPEPPPRVIETVTELLPEPVGDLPLPSGMPPPVSPPRPGRTTSPKPDARATEKPADPKPVEPVPVEPPPPPPAPAAQLRTPQTADTGAAAKTVRTTIDTAQGLLNTVNYGLLTNERKKAYNDAKKLLEQAEDALKKSDLVFAQGVATKAETLAKELAGR
jgi:hypothetical protein